MVKEIISGGQTGADEGGLLAAKILGLRTGGLMPLGFKRQDNRGAVVARYFDLHQSISPSYQDRTFHNVSASDGTARFASDFSTPGERCTLKAIAQYAKPYIDISPYILFEQSKDEFISWITQHGIEILNVAGNSTRNWREATLYTARFLIRVLDYDIPHR
jgi:hypothetical protein